MWQMESFPLITEEAVRQGFEAATIRVGGASF